MISYSGSTTIGYDRWPLSNALQIKFYNGNGKYKPKLSEYIQMYQCQLNFLMFCATSVLDILGNILTIQIHLYAVFVNFMCIFMYERYCIIQVFHWHIRIVLARLRVLTIKVHVTAGLAVSGGRSHPHNPTHAIFCLAVRLSHP